MTCVVDKISHDWLVDTGASISAIKRECVERLKIPIHKNEVRIVGIGGDIVSIGLVCLN